MVSGHNITLLPSISNNIWNSSLNEWRTLFVPPGSRLIIVSIHFGMNKKQFTGPVLQFVSSFIPKQLYTPNASSYTNDSDEIVIWWRKHFASFWSTAASSPVFFHGTKFSQSFNRFLLCFLCLQAFTIQLYAWASFQEPNEDITLSLFSSNQSWCLCWAKLIVITE